MDPHEVLRQADLGPVEVRRRAGGTPATGSDAVRQRFAALLRPVPGVDEPASGTLPDDTRHCGALVVRLGDLATATAIAAWMGWTLERTAAAAAEVDRRLHPVGLQLVAEAGGHLVICDRVRLRVRPRQSPFELLTVLDNPGHRHALGHLVRGDQCDTGEDWVQPLFDLGAAVPADHPGAHPCDALGAAFAGVRRRSHPQLATVIGASRR